MINTLVSAVTVISIFLAGNIYAQDLAFPQVSNKQSFIIFDSIVGLENTGIFNGMEYVEKHRMINDKHKFFGSYDFLTGTVFYDGQPYFNIPLKYNVFQDLVLVRLESERSRKIFKLYDEKLDGFIVDNHKFINIPDVAGLATKGINEVLVDDSGFLLLKKHHLREEKILEKEVLYFEFEQDDPEYFFGKEGQIKEVTRQSLQDYFPEQEDRIRRYYRSNRKGLKSNPDSFLAALYKDLILRRNE